jgi:repressor LexA
MQKALTQKQKVVLATIKDLSKKLDKSPTLEEIRQALEYTRISSVQRHVDALKKKGYIINEKFQNRSIEFTTNIVNIPLVGNVACGTPLYAEENIEAYVPYKSSNIKVEDYFFLRAIGDSMNDTNIKGKTIDDGDFVLVKQTNSADFGDRVVALIGEEATIKKIKSENGYVKLIPESTNPANKPIILFEEPVIQGKVVDVLKKGNK